MSARPITYPTSWRYQAAIHDYIRTRDPLAVNGETMPSSADQTKYWRQCQHGSWFFLPWHRGYLAYFEQIVRAEIVRQGGPADWALPYWNYSDDEEPNADSSGGNNSAIFRLTTRSKSFGNVRVGFRLYQNKLVSTPSTTAVAWDGVHIFLRYQSRESLYYASVNRRDGRVVIKKKCMGGPRWLRGPDTRSRPGAGRT